MYLLNHKHIFRAKKVSLGQFSRICDATKSLQSASLFHAYCIQRTHSIRMHDLTNEPVDGPKECKRAFYILWIGLVIFYNVRE